MKRQFFAIAVVALIASLVFGCAPPKPPVMQDGKQVTMFVLSDRGIKSGTKEDERNDRNEMGQFIEEDLVNALKHEGYNATLIKNRNQYVQGPVNYLVTVKIIDLRLVGRASRGWLGYASGPTILKAHYEVSGSSKKLALAYDDEDATTNDWTSSPRELNQRLAQKINDKLVGKAPK
jgi:hypothetical protein